MTTTVLPAATAPDDEARVQDLQDAFVGVAGSSLEPAVAKLPPLRAEYLDPRVLLDNPRNLRSEDNEHGFDPASLDTDDLKASMSEVGILCPLVVHENADDQVMIIIGHRRKYAAIALDFPLVPCLIVADEGEVARVIAQLAENGHRVGLTPTQEARGFEQLIMAGFTAEKIAKVRHIPVTQVKQHLTLHSLPVEARAAADTGQLDLQDAAVMAEFADQPAVLNRILKSAKTAWGFKHAVATEKTKRDYAAAKKRLEAELIVAGVNVTSKPKGWGYTNPATEAVRLVDADGERLDIDKVKALPGFAAFIDRIVDTPKPIVYCVNPEQYGYTLRAVANRYGHETPEARAEREQTERDHEALLGALKVAQGVRGDFYRQTYTAARTVKKLFPSALRAVVAARGEQRMLDVEDLYTGLGGVSGQALADAKEALLSRCLVAQWICHQEANLRRAGTGWYIDEDAALAWLDQLVADGYTLSDAEATVRQNLLAEDDEEDDEDLTDDEDADNQQGEDDQQEQEGTGGDIDVHVSDDDAADEPDGIEHAVLAEVTDLPVRADDDGPALAA